MLSSILDERSAELSRLITTEVAKPLRESVAEVKKSAEYCAWLAEHAPAILAPRRLAVDAVARYAPLGLIAGILPWNFPVWQAFRFAAPALMAGNRVVIKHSPLVPRCAVAIEEVFCAAGFDRDAFTCRAGSSDDAQRLIACDAVRAVSFTGRSEIGRLVAAAASMHLKKCVLELGGSDAFIVMPTAQVGAAVAAAVASRTRAAGQACTSAKRFIVSDAVANEFETKLVSSMQVLVVGDPFADSTDVGPLVDEGAAENLDRQVRDSIRAGATILTGGVRLGTRFYAPTVVRTTTTQIPLMQEETFGPVAPVMRVSNIREAIHAANDTPFGLSASVWTNDRADIEAFSSGLDCGQVFINTVAVSRFDLPFGGIKASGWGRTLGDAALLEFTNMKIVRPA